MLLFYLERGLWRQSELIMGHHPVSFNYADSGMSGSPAALFCDEMTCLTINGCLPKEERSFKYDGILYVWPRYCMLGPKIVVSPAQNEIANHI